MQIDVVTTLETLASLIVRDFMTQCQIGVNNGKSVRIGGHHVSFVRCFQQLPSCFVAFDRRDGKCW